MTSIAVIRAEVENKVPGALTSYQRIEGQRIPTGIASLDAMTGGLPRGALTQICAAGNASVGRTMLLVSTMVQLVGKQECCACLTPEPAKLEITLARLRAVVGGERSTWAGACGLPRG